MGTTRHSKDELLARMALLELDAGDRQRDLEDLPPLEPKLAEQLMDTYRKARDRDAWISAVARGLGLKQALRAVVRQAEPLPAEVAELMDSEQPAVDPPLLARVMTWLELRMSDVVDAVNTSHEMGGTHAHAALGVMSTSPRPMQSPLEAVFYMEQLAEELEKLGRLDLVDPGVV